MQSAGRKARKRILRTPQWLRPLCRAWCSAHRAQSGGEVMETAKGNCPSGVGGD